MQSQNSSNEVWTNGYINVNLSKLAKSRQLLFCTVHQTFSANVCKTTSNFTRIVKDRLPGWETGFFPCFPLTQDLKNRYVKLLKNYKKLNVFKSEVGRE